MEEQEHNGLVLEIRLPAGIPPTLWRSTIPTRPSLILTVHSFKAEPLLLTKRSLRTMPAGSLGLPNRSLLLLLETGLTAHKLQRSFGISEGIPIAVRLLIRE